MKKYLLLFFLFFLGFLEAKPLILVSSESYRYLVEKVAKSKVYVKVLNKKSLLDNKDLKALKKAKLYFTAGFEFEKEINSQISKKKIIELNGNSKYIYYNILDPFVVRDHMKIIYKQLSALDKKNKIYYKTNYDNFLKEIDKIYITVRKNLESLKYYNVFVMKPFLTYFASRFGLVQNIIKLKANYPNVKELNNLIEIAKKKKIKIVFITDRKNFTSAATIASSIGAKVEYIDPFEYNWPANLRELSMKLVR